MKAPMDLSTLLTNIDEQKYVTVDEFVCDADLIWKNALEYNPDSDPMGETPPPRRPPRDQKECFYSQNCIHFKVFVCVCVSDRHIRHRACALRDALRSIIRAELNEGFQRACEEIRASRTQRGEVMKHLEEIFGM